MQLGEKLKQTREARSIELEHISNRTKININFLKDMEKGTFDFLPELYVRHFLKLYIRQLGEDTSKFLDEYDAITTGEELDVTIVTEEDIKDFIKPKQLRNQISHMIEKIKPYIRQLNFIWFAIGGLIIILIIYSLVKNGNDQQIMTAGSTNKSLMKVQKNSLDTSSSLFANKLFNRKKELLVLELKALERTWLQISIDDSVAKEYLFESGMDSSWQAEEKFKLWVGNAAGIRLFLNGKDLGPLGQAGKVIKIDVAEDGIQNNSL